MRDEGRSLNFPLRGGLPTPIRIDPYFIMKVVAIEGMHPFEWIMEEREP